MKLPDNVRISVDQIDAKAAIIITVNARLLSFQYNRYIIKINSLNFPKNNMTNFITSIKNTLNFSSESKTFDLDSLFLRKQEAAEATLLFVLLDATCLQQQMERLSSTVTTNAFAHFYCLPASNVEELRGVYAYVDDYVRNQRTTVLKECSYLQPQEVSLAYRLSSLHHTLSRAKTLLAISDETPITQGAILCNIFQASQLLWQENEKEGRKSLVEEIYHYIIRDATNPGEIKIFLEELLHWRDKIRHHPDLHDDTSFVTQLFQEVKEAGLGNTSILINITQLLIRRKFKEHIFLLEEVTDFTESDQPAIPIDPQDPLIKRSQQIARLEKIITMSEKITRFQQYGVMIQINQQDAIGMLSTIKNSFSTSSDQELNALENTLLCFRQSYLHLECVLDFSFGNNISDLISFYGKTANILLNPPRSNLSALYDGHVVLGNFYTYLNLPVEHILPLIAAIKKILTTEQSKKFVENSLSFMAQSQEAAQQDQRVIEALLSIHNVDNAASFIFSLLEKTLPPNPTPHDLPLVKKTKENPRRNAAAAHLQQKTSALPTSLTKMDQEENTPSFITIFLNTLEKRHPGIFEALHFPMVMSHLIEKNSYILHLTLLHHAVSVFLKDSVDEASAQTCVCPLPIFINILNRTKNPNNRTNIEEKSPLSIAIISARFITSPADKDTHYRKILTLLQAPAVQLDPPLPRNYLFHPFIAAYNTGNATLIIAYLQHAAKKGVLQSLIKIAVKKSSNIIFMHLHDEYDVAPALFSEEKLKRKAIKVLTQQLDALDDYVDKRSPTLTTLAKLKNLTAQTTNEQLSNLYKAKINTLTQEIDSKLAFFATAINTVLNKKTDDGLHLESNYFIKNNQVLSAADKGAPAQEDPSLPEAAANDTTSSAADMPPRMLQP